MTATTRPEFGSVSEPTLYVAFELSTKQWTLGDDRGIWRGPVGADGAAWSLGEP